MTSRVRDNRDFNQREAGKVSRYEIDEKLDEIIEKLEKLDDPNIYDIVDEIRHIQRLIFEAMG